MRKSARTISGEKFYINTTLCVTGAKIQIQKPAVSHNKKINTRSFFRNTTVQPENPDVAVESAKDKQRDNGVETSCGKQKRIYVKPTVTDLKSAEVSNKLLRRIYETVEVRDFERILGDFYVKSRHFKKQKKEHDDGIFNLINPSEIYREHFSNYYDSLKIVLSERS